MMQTQSTNDSLSFHLTDLLSMIFEGLNFVNKNLRILNYSITTAEKSDNLQNYFLPLLKILELSPNLTSLSIEFKQ